MTKAIRRFLLVDDDPTSNYLAHRTILQLIGEAEVLKFVDPEEALGYIEKQFLNEPQEERTILFLDINMPVTTGWEFLEKFKAFEEPVKMQFRIYILSSSIDPADIKLAELSPLVVNFIEKPLTKIILTKILGGLT